LLTNRSHAFLPFSSDMCNLRIDPGPCLAIHYRWGWDNRRRQCIRFRYGGCGGNPNRFPSKLACQLACRYRVSSTGVIISKHVTGLTSLERFLNAKRLSWDNTKKSFVWAYISNYCSLYLAEVQCFMMIIRLANPLRKTVRVYYTSQALAQCHHCVNFLHSEFSALYLARQLNLLW
uniref:BPTI/Kunitz inhibitor domain-containing protein n=1 Tax=Echinostoma caproni TaxID=27848 RepID=A0A183B0L2_9TREM